MIQLCIVCHIFRDVADGDIITLIIVVDVSFHLKQVDDAFELIFLTDGQLKNDSVLAKSCSDLIYSSVEICTQDIHLVDECHTRYVVSISLSPNILGLRLYTTLSTENADSAIQYTKRTLNLNGKVYVSGGINNIDTML